MAVEKFYDALVTLDGTGGPPLTGGTALANVRSVTLNYSADMLDITEMGNSTKVNLSGLLEWSVDVAFLHNWATTENVQTLFAKVGAVAFNIQIQPKTGTVGASLPEYYGLVVLETANPMDGAVGEATEISASFRCAGPLVQRVA